MFQQDVTSQADAVPFRASGETAAPRYRDYMVSKDGRPFLIVNATLAHVREVVAGFVRVESGAHWTFEPFAR